MFYTFLSVVCESQTYQEISSQWIHTRSLFFFSTLTQTHRQISMASQLQSVRRLNISQQAETWQRHWVHLNVSLCETRGRQIKYSAQNVTHTQTHRSEEVSDRGFRGDLYDLDICLCRMSNVIFPSSLWKIRQSGESDWSKSMQGKGCPADVSSHLLPFYFILCCFFLFFFNSQAMSLFIIFLNLPSSPHLFPFTLASGGITIHFSLKLGLKGYKEYISYY